MNIPVVKNFDWSQVPRGFAEVVDGKVVMKLKDGFDPKLYDVLPAFIVTKHDKDGVVTEAELIGLSVVLKPTAYAKKQKEWQKKTAETHPMYNSTS